jgi:hypothetical protein
MSFIFITWWIPTFKMFTITNFICFYTKTVIMTFYFIFMILTPIKIILILIMLWITILFKTCFLFRKLDISKIVFKHWIRKTFINTCWILSQIDVKTIS